MERLAFSRVEITFLIGVPLVWGILLLFHPTGAGQLYPALHDEVTRWEIVHVGTMILIPLMAIAVYLLLRGIESTAAQVSRIALALFAVFYAAWEILLGIGVGVLTSQVNDLPERDRSVGAGLVEGFDDNALIGDPGVFTAIGGLGWVVAVIAAAIAIRGIGGPLSAAVLLGLSAMVIAHPPPIGPVGLASFILAVLILLRANAASTPTAKPPG